VELAMEKVYESITALRRLREERCGAILRVTSLVGL
jgi:hypothetical protein